MPHNLTAFDDHFSKDDSFIRSSAALQFIGEADYDQKLPSTLKGNNNAMNRLESLDEEPEFIKALVKDQDKKSSDMYDKPLIISS